MSDIKKTGGTLSANTNRQLFGSDASRQKLVIFNGDDTYPIYVEFDAPASTDPGDGSWVVLPGDDLVLYSDQWPEIRGSVNAKATAPVVFVARTAGEADVYDGETGGGEIPGTWGTIRTEVEKNGSLVGTRRTLNFIEGSGISLTIADDNTDDEVDITIGTTAALNVFKSISVSGQDTVVADSNTDTLTLVAGTNIGITTDATTDTVTFALGSTIDAAKIADGTVSNTEFQYVNGVTSAIQTQLDAKVDENAAITGATKTKITYDAKGLVTAGDDIAASDLPTGIDAAKIADGSVSNTEFQYVNGVTSAIQTQLDGKSNTGHTHTASNITDFATEVDARITLQKGAANGVATLDATTKIPSSQLPGLALTDVYTVSSQSAQLALAAEEGDIAIRTDLNKTYAHNGGTAGTMADWSELLTPTDVVQSVNGETGTVVLDTGDIAEVTDKKYVTDAEKTKLSNLSGTNTGDQTITLTGDVTGTGTGSFAATIGNSKVTYAKIQDVSATDKILGRSTAGAGVVEEITCTSAGRALIDDVDAAAQRTTLGLGTLATQNGTFSGTSSGTNTGDQNVFTTVAVAGQNNVVADSTSDTLTLVAGTGITITTNDTSDSVTITSSAAGPSIGGTLTGGTAGSVLFSGSGVFAQDNANLFFDDANNRLGVGTSSPSTTVHVISSTEQLRVGFDPNNYYKTTVGNTGVVTFDAVGSGSKFTFSDAVEVPDDAYASGWNGSTAVPTKNAVYDRLEVMKTESFIIACSDETTALTTGTAKVKFRMPYAFTVTAVRASLSTAQASGNIFTVDINEHPNGGSLNSILGTKLTIDNTETTSTTAATAATITDSSLADDAEISVDIDQVGASTAAKGLKVVIIGYKS